MSILFVLKALEEKKNKKNQPYIFSPWIFFSALYIHCISLILLREPHEKVNIKYMRKILNYRGVIRFAILPILNLRMNDA